MGALSKQVDTQTGGAESVTSLPLEWASLREWAAATAKLDLSAGQLEQLRTYLDVLLLWNRKLALVSQRDPSEILCKHFADSLFAAAHCADGEAVADLGSGAGFPGLTIAIVRPAARVCLIEARGRKASFLEEARRATAARNAAVRHSRIESAAADPEHRARYAVVTARALTRTRELVELARPLLAPDGRVIAMRSVGESRAGEPSAAESIAYELPDGTSRRLLIVRPP